MNQPGTLVFGTEIMPSCLDEVAINICYMDSGKTCVNSA